jgi:DNA-binding SARP family transcriptional activator
VSALELYVLGSPRLVQDGVTLALDSRKNLALIAYLAMTGQSHTREALITLLWPELEPSRGRAGLRRSLSVIKKALGGEWLVVDREIIGSDPDADFWLDVVQFRHLLRVWQGHGHPEEKVCPDCLTALTEAAELYRGDFMAGFSLRDSANFDEWQFFQTEGLRQELASTLKRLVRGHSAQAAYQTAIPYARRCLALDPLHEPTQRQLMELYGRAGQRSAALRQYAECARVLEEELGLTPSEETTALYEKLRTRGVDRGPGPRHNLPAQVTPFLGREKELRDVQGQLGDPNCRLLTLVGTGGIGKTRLALRAAELACETQAERFEHGVYFVRLGPLQSAEGSRVITSNCMIRSPFSEKQGNSDGALGPVISLYLP